MKRAVITGPTGSIGLALINELVSNGVEVVAVVRPPISGLFLFSKR